MKTYYSNNSELNEILVANGINLICDDNMQVKISDEDAERVPAIVAEFAPAASGDYTIE